MERQCFKARRLGSWRSRSFVITMMISVRTLLAGLGGLIVLSRWKERDGKSAMERSGSSRRC